VLQLIKSNGVGQRTYFFRLIDFTGVSAPSTSPSSPFMIWWKQ